MRKLPFKILEIKCLVRHTAAQKMSIAVCHHPFGPVQMALPRPPRAIGLLHRIDPQNDPHDLDPIGAFGFSVQKPQVADEVLFVVVRQRIGCRGEIGKFGIEERLTHGVFCSAGELAFPRHEAVRPKSIVLH